MAVPPNLPQAERLVVIGAGKASAAMAAAVEATSPGDLSGLVVTRYGYSMPCKKIEIVEAAHPVPDAAGAAAAERMLTLLSGLDADAHVLALISGGGSSLLTLLPEGLPLEMAAALNRALLASGAPIGAVNCIRRHLSRTGGGRLAAAAHPARITALLISDVPGDDPLDIASGPTVGDPTTLADARAAVAAYAMDLPAPLLKALEDPKNESIKPGDPRLARAETRVIARPQGALDAAAAAATRAGIEVDLLGDALEGEARVLGADMAALALARQKERAGKPPLVLLSGGETSVSIPKDGRALGTGGRNVDFLMGFAEAAAGAPGLWALAADTDGIDGMAEVAGAVVAPDTMARAGDAFAKALHSYDGHGLFAALGDQIVTGPTLTNVNDFRAIWIEAP
ncbi:MAG: DUF4147 domain-containing protein [Pseudomonadota bacterium]